MDDRNRDDFDRLTSAEHFAKLDFENQMKVLAKFQEIQQERTNTIAGAIVGLGFFGVFGWFLWLLMR